MSNKKQLIERIASKANITRAEAEGALHAVCDAIAAELMAGNQVRLLGFGTFSVGERAERQGRNPKTGEAITIAASKVVKFKAGKALKEAVN